jgi:SulP family sulfate permease
MTSRVLRNTLSAQSFFSNIKGDFSGGIVAATLPIAGSVTYGLIAFAPLGPAYASIGILAGLYSTVLGGFLSSNPIMIAGARAPSAILLGGIATQLMTTDSSLSPMTILTLVFFAVFLSGVFQFALGMLRFGSVVKYISYPVMAGILNGTALLILFKAFWGYLGVPKQPLSAVWSDPGQIQPLIGLIALVTTLSWWKGGRYIRAIPGTILSILGGTSLYYGLRTLGYGEHIGGTMMALPSTLPHPDYVLGFIDGFATIVHPQLWPILLSGALVLAILGSADSLMAMLTAQNLSHQLGNANRELIGCGIGNIVTSFFGTLPAAGIVSTVIVCYRAGARTRLAGALRSLMLLLVVLFGARYFDSIPQAVITGMMAMVGLIVVDRWSLQLVNRVLRKHVSNRHELIMNLGIILVVMAIVVYFNIMIAVVAGIVISGTLFLMQMSKSIIRNTYNGAKIHSRYQRDIKTMEMLRLHGDQIAILELEGTIFFGATDDLAKSIDRLITQGAQYVILDLKRTKGADISGARMLVQLYTQIQQRGYTLVFSYLSPNTALWAFLDDLGLLPSLSPEHLFVDTDQALEYCENILLSTIGTKQERNLTMVIQNIFGIDADDMTMLQALKECLIEKTFETGEFLCRQGEPGDNMYIITQGVVEVSIQIPGTNRNKRLATQDSGTILGEIALLDQGKRTADVKAMQDVTCYIISIDALEYLKRERPRVAVLILDTVSKILVARSRQHLETIAELES